MPPSRATGTQTFLLRLEQRLNPPFPPFPSIFSQNRYYHKKFGVDFRSLRYPGVISAKTQPGGGTTDYAVEIYHSAIHSGRYTCFLDEQTALPMIYMPDLLKATELLMKADVQNRSCALSLGDRYIYIPNENVRMRENQPPTRLFPLLQSSKLSRRVYNLGAMSFTPRELASSIQKHIPNFEMDVAPDFRQKIADSWPRKINDSLATSDWGWQPDYDVDAMTTDMINYLTTEKAIADMTVHGH